MHAIKSSSKLLNLKLVISCLNFQSLFKVIIKNNLIVSNKINKNNYHMIKSSVSRYESTNYVSITSIFVQLNKFFLKTISQRWDNILSTLFLLSRTVLQGGGVIPLGTSQHSLGLLQTWHMCVVVALQQKEHTRPRTVSIPVC